MILRHSFLCTTALWLRCLFPLSNHPTEPREYFCPPSVHQSNYLSDIKVSSYRSKFEKPIPDWLKETVEHELADFKEYPITQNGLAATYNRIMSHGYPQTRYIRRYRIIGEKIYAYNTLDYEVETDLILRTLARLSDFPGIPNLPNVDFMVNHNDGMPMPYDPPGFWITSNRSDQAPVLSGGKRVGSPYVVLIPHRTPMPSWPEKCRTTINARCAWSDKIRMACWRGNVNLTAKVLAGPDAELIDYCIHEPRSLLCSLSLSHPDLINAGLTYSIDWIPSTALKNVIRPYIKGFLPIEDHVRYAYLPVLDGAMISGGGFEWRLLANSLVFKPNSLNVAWFEHGVKPYIHYVPIQSHMEDLIEKIHWARAHDEQCARIASQGAAFASENLLIEGIYFYIFQLLKEYEKHQAFSTADLLQECEMNSGWTRIR